jgi:hypothetical protein
VARPWATPAGSRLPTQAAPSITRASTRAAAGPRPNGASGRLLPSGASRRPSTRSRKVELVPTTGAERNVLAPGATA